MFLIAAPKLQAVDRVGIILCCCSDHHDLIMIITVGTDLFGRLKRAVLCFSMCICRSFCKDSEAVHLDNRLRTAVNGYHRLSHILAAAIGPDIQVMRCSQLRKVLSHLVFIHHFYMHMWSLYCTCEQKHAQTTSDPVRASVTGDLQIDIGNVKNIYTQF
jgi:hypothetical protein